MTNYNVKEATEGLPHLAPQQSLWPSLHRSKLWPPAMAGRRPEGGFPVPSLSSRAMPLPPPSTLRTQHTTTQTSAPAAPWPGMPFPNPPTTIPFITRVAFRDSLSEFLTSERFHVETELSHIPIFLCLFQGSQYELFSHLNCTVPQILLINLII